MNHRIMYQTLIVGQILKGKKNERKKSKPGKIQNVNYDTNPCKGKKKLYIYMVLIFSGIKQS